MKRLVILLGLLVLSGLLAACSSGGGDEDTEVLPLEVQFVVASPNAGTEPLRAVLTTVITGGKAPFFYAWDFTSDGAPDSFDNGQYSRTANVVHDYFRRASDGLENSVYSASLVVTDSEGTVVSPDPIPVTVLAQGGLAGMVSWTNDSDDGQAHSGEPVFFSVVASGGNAPYSYAWDFGDADFPDGDGASDSSIQNPQHTFYYNDDNSFGIFAASVTITDANGQTLPTRDDFGELLITDNVARVLVAGTGYEPDPDQGFEITLNSDPISGPGTPYPVIELKYDPTQAEPGAVPLEPELDLSVVVDPFGGGGVQPFEYYWDFDNDGSIESQAPSPSVPFYDFRRKILINTYTHTLDTKTFTLRCMVIDGTGRIENAYRSVVVQNISNSVDLVVVPDYGVDPGDGSGLKPYGPVTDTNGADDLRDELTRVVFNFSISGSTGEYDFQFDANGDGVPEVPAGGGFELVSGSQITLDPNLPDSVAPYQGVGYFPAKITVRSLQSGAPAQTVVLEVPVSLVGRQSVAYNGDLDVRFGHTVESSWTAAAGGGNGQYLTSRELIIVGGAVGNTPLNSVEKVIEEYPPLDPPATAGDVEVSVSVQASNRIPILHPRKGAMMWTEGSNYYVHGGEGENGVIHAFVEAIPIDDNGGAAPWTDLSDIAGYFPLKYAMATKVTDLNTDISPYSRDALPGMVFDALVFCGGVNDPEDSDADEVNAMPFFYRSAPAISEPPFWGDVDADQMFLSHRDSYGAIGSLMITPRHEGCLVWNPNNRMLYAIGGRTSSGQSVATVERFDLDTKFWQPMPPMNNARAGGVAEFIGGQIYIMGGSNYPENEGAQVVLETAEVYNPITGVWTETLPPVVSTHQPAAAAMPGPGSVSNAGVNLNTIWYFGGSTDQGETNVFEEFVYFHDVALPDDS